MSQDLIRKFQKDLMAGKPQSAFKKARVAAKKSPETALYQNLAGAALAESGDHGAAIPWFQRALKLSPGHPEYQANLALALIMSKQRDRASLLIDRLLEMRPEDPQALHLRVINRYLSTDWRGAIEAADAVLARDPRHVDALNFRGQAKSELGQPEAALEDFHAILRIRPNDTLAMQNAAERLNELGQREEARAMYGRILAADPENAEALQQIVTLAPMDRLPEIAKLVNAALSRQGKSDDDRAALHMAAARIAERQGDTALAMEQFSRAHEIDASRAPATDKAACTEFQKATRIFLQSVTPSHPLPDSPRPIFVVGLPRSGTTLVEMILTAAEGVASCGELDAGARVAHDFLEKGESLTPERLDRVAQDYMARVPDLPEGTRAFVDKLPANYRRIGLLLAAFPTARVVNIERDPRDVALSIWKQRFRGQGMRFANRLSSIAHEENLYRAYMYYWRQAYADRILTVRYEDLVQDIQAESRRLAEHCGLDWDPAMMHPEDNRARVRTASLHQVRNKVHAASIGGWQVFGDRIRELTDRLEPELWPELKAELWPDRDSDQRQGS
ncbi:tetratricopeptide repeat protein [Aquicoccus sp. SCR17]|nr:tetratricopeptide repeat protein [Carideicomes alvinocaridis]